MARKTAADRQLEEALKSMPAIAEATRKGSYLFTGFLTHSILTLNGLVEVNENIKNENNEVATRATKKGLEQFMSDEKFVIVDVAVPKVARSGNRKSQYPFDKLAVGQSFFVPATEKVPEPAKSLASSVAAAMRKYDVPDLDENGVQKTKDITVPKTGEKRTIPKMKHTVVLKIVSIEDGAAYGYEGVAGAVIGRTA